MMADRLLKPYWGLRYILALLAVYAEGGWRRLTKHVPLWWGWGRHDDPTPIRCHVCGWAGMTRWLYHGYADDGSGEDVEPQDYCPRCGSEV